MKDQLSPACCCVYVLLKGLRACLVRVRVRMVSYAVSYEKDVSYRPLRCRVETLASLPTQPKTRGKATHPLPARCSRRHLLRTQEWLSLAAFAPRLPSVVYRLLSFQEIPIERVVAPHPQRAARS